MAYDVYCAFDAEDATPVVQVELLEGCIETAKARGIAADLEALLPHCAHVLGVSPAELRATYEQRRARDGVLRATRGGEHELASLTALRDSQGRFGVRFDDAAAAAIGEAWPRMAGPALAKALFAGDTYLRLQNLGPLGTLAGLEQIKGLTALEVELTADCDLEPLTSLKKLRTLVLAGKREGYGPLARVKSLTDLTVTTTARGLGELAAIPRLRVLTLTVAPDVPLAGLLDLKELNLVRLDAGPRALADDTTMRALARKKRLTLRLLSPGGWSEAPGISDHLGIIRELD